MDFITQFENTLEQTVNCKLWAEAETLLAAYPATRQPYTLKLFSLINQVRQHGSSHPLRIVLFKTENYILNYILGQFDLYFQRAKNETFLFDPSDYAQSSDKLFAFAKNGIDAAYFFNNVGLLQTLSDGRNLWEVLHVPCYNFLVDHPMYYSDSLDYAPDRTTLLCADLTHAEYATRFYPRIRNAVFLPTGGCELPKTCTSLQEREIDLLFIGSYKYHSAYEQDTLDHRITKHLMQHTEHTFEQAVSLCLTSEDPRPLKEVIEQHRFTETNLTASYRLKLMQQLLEGGLEIHVYGNGWETTGLCRHPNFHLHPPVSFEEGLDLISHAKILLNHMAWFKHGSGERIFNAMALGTVCVTDSSRFLQPILENGANCLLYSLSEICHTDSDIATRISNLLSSQEDWQKISDNGLKTAAEHTWQKHLHCAIMDLV